MPGAGDLLGDARGAVGAGAQAVQLDVGHAAAVAADAAGVGAGVRVLEARRRRKVERGEGAGFSEMVAGRGVSMYLDGVLWEEGEGRTGWASR